MKVSSATKPESVNIIVVGDRAVIRFAENVTEEKREDGTLFVYDEYQIETKNRSMLKISVEKNYEAWLVKAKQAEADVLAAEIREKRNKMLAETDFYFLTDRELDSAKRSALEAYRQALRDITEQPGFPYAVVWPEVV